MVEVVITSPYNTPSNTLPRITSIFSITVPILVSGSPWLPQLHQIELHHSAIFIITHISLVSFRRPNVKWTWYSHVYLEHESIFTVTHISLVSSSQWPSVPPVSTMNNKLACRAPTDLSVHVTHHSPNHRFTHRQWKKS